MSTGLYSFARDRDTGWFKPLYFGFIALRLVEVRPVVGARCRTPRVSCGLTRTCGGRVERGGLYMAIFRWLWWLGVALSISSCASDPCCASCEIISVSDVAWNAETALGAPEAIFAEVEGTCEAPFSWNGGRLSEVLDIEPESGESTVTVSVSLDHTSARIVKQRPKGTGGDISCPTVLEVSGRVSLSLPEGIIFENHETRVVYVEEQGASAGTPTLWITGTVTVDDLKDWVVVGAEEGTSVTASFDIMPLRTECAGTIGLRADAEKGQKSLFVSLVDFATWSDPVLDGGVDGGSLNL